VCLLWFFVLLFPVISCIQKSLEFGIIILILIVILELVIVEVYKKFLGVVFTVTFLIFVIVFLFIVIRDIFYICNVFVKESHMGNYVMVVYFLLGDFVYMVV